MAAGVGDRGLGDRRARQRVVKPVGPAIGQDLLGHQPAGIIEGGQIGDAASIGNGVQAVAAIVR